MVFKIFSLLRFFLRIIILTFFAAFLIVVTQDFQIFPGAFQGKWMRSLQKDSLANEINQESFFINGRDSNKIETWVLRPEAQTNKKVAVIFHGNNDSLSTISPISNWAKDLGYIVYSFHYRGYGKSSGWPNENNIYNDAETVINYLLDKEKVTARDLLIIGYSLGTAFAAQAASKYQVGKLILFAPFANLANVVKSRLVYKYLVDFLWYKLPTEDYVAKLKDSQIIILSAGKDQVVPLGEAEKIISHYPDRNKIKYIISETAQHNDLFYKTKAELTELFHKFVDVHQESSSKPPQGADLRSKSRG